eukprot:9062382-Pyramimonas_sp.AAC.1
MHAHLIRNAQACQEGSLHPGPIQGGMFQAIFSPVRLEASQLPGRSLVANSCALLDSRRSLSPPRAA